MSSKRTDPFVVMYCPSLSIITLLVLTSALSEINISTIVFPGWGGRGGFPGSSTDKESTCNARSPGLIPGLGRSPGEGIGYPLQYS